jgi:molecular chaperone GrpE
MASDEIHKKGNGMVPGPSADEGGAPRAGAPDAPAPEAEEKSDKQEHETVENIIDDLEKRAVRAETQAQELHDRLLRTAAEFENFKKRTKKEVDESMQKGREQMLKEVLPVIDNLERALKHAPGPHDDPLVKGVAMVEKQLLQALEKFGVTRFSALGQPFDPNMHDAIQQVETSEHPAGTVAQEYSSGYLSNGKLLRPAMVAVAKKPEASGPA